MEFGFKPSITEVVRHFCNIIVSCVSASHRTVYSLALLAVFVVEFNDIFDALAERGKRGAMVTDVY